MQRAVIKGVGSLALLLLAGCTDRGRLLFPPVTDGEGPRTFIDQPNLADTTVRAGPGAAISGKTIDPDGVDSVYVVLIGGNERFQPFVGGRDTLRFGFTINTGGLAGDTVFVLIFGTDRLGNRGDTAVRRVAIKP